MNPDIRSGLADTLIKVTVVLIAGGVFAVAAANAPAARRHLVWLLTVCAALLMPVLCVLLPAWRVLPMHAGTDEAVRTAPIVNLEQSLPHTSNTVDTNAPASPRSTVTATPSRASLGPPLRPSPATPGVRIARADSPRPEHLLALSVLLIWSAGCVLLLARLAFSWIMLWRLAARASRVVPGPLADLLARSRAQLNLRRQVILRMGGRHGMPMTWGVIRPVVLLPPEAEGWPVNRLRFALLHELAHVRRLDALAHLITRFACAVYWFHPLIWVAAAGLRREQERSADDRVLSLTTRGPDYASFLLDLAAGRGSHGAGPSAAIAMARPTALEGRLRAILDAGRRREPLSLRAVLAAVAVAAALVMPVAALRAQPQPSPAKSAPTQPAEGGVRYAGHILAPDGKSVAGAEVVLQGHANKGLGTEELVAARSDADGAFVLQTAPPDDKQNRPWIQAWAPGFGPVAVPAEGEQDHAVRLATPSSVRVIFLGPDGLPVPGLRVTPRGTIANFSPVHARSLPQWVFLSPNWSAHFARTTGVDGSCVFDMLPRASRTTLQVDDDRFATFSRADEVQTGSGPQSAPITIHLTPAGVISGKVTYGTTHAPAPGITLLAIDRKGGDDSRQIVTNQQGEYRIPQVREGDYVMHVYSHDDIRWTASFLKGVHVTPGGTVADQDLVLVKGTVVHGRVYEADTGRPYPPARRRPTRTAALRCASRPAGRGSTSPGPRRTGTPATSSTAGAINASL
jgi:beta-lactamase regulating signal transducer with metallopeptidase domain